MKRPRIAAALATLAVALTAAPAALAHTHVHHTSIADKASLATPPASFTVEFEGKTGLASVSLTDGAGKAVPLAYKPPTDPAASFTIPLPTLAKGSYMLMWRTIGQDGHAMPGRVSFTITG
ncbi:MAG: copper resistance CopC family protein [Hyphomonadaceae bacterium]